MQKKWSLEKEAYSEGAMQESETKTNFLRKKNLWQDLTTVKMWIDTKSKHFPNENTNSIRKLSHGKSFYVAAKKWCENQDSLEKLFDQIFPPKKFSDLYTALKTKEGFKEKYENEPILCGKNIKQLSKERNGRRFIYHLNKFCEKESQGCKIVTDSLYRFVVPTKRIRFNTLKTEDDWRIFFDHNNQFQDKTFKEISAVCGGHEVWRNYGEFCSKISGYSENKNRKTRDIKDLLFSKHLCRVRKSTICNETLADWLDEQKSLNLAKVPLSIARDTLGVDEAAFVDRLYEFFRANKFNAAKQAEWIKEMFPEYKVILVDFKKDQEPVRFDSLEEARIGVFLHDLGLIKRFEPGKNLHVKLNKGNQKKTSIDFVLDEKDSLGRVVLLEHHPVHYTIKRQGVTSSDEKSRKIKDIKDICDYCLVYTDDIRNFLEQFQKQLKDYLASKIFADEDPRNISVILKNTWALSSYKLKDLLCKDVAHITKNNKTGKHRKRIDYSFIKTKEDALKILRDEKILKLKTLSKEHYSLWSYIHYSPWKNEIYNEMSWSDKFATDHWNVYETVLEFAIKSKISVLAKLRNIRPKGQSVAEAISRNGWGGRICNDMGWATSDKWLDYNNHVIEFEEKKCKTESHYKARNIEAYRAAVDLEFMDRLAKDCNFTRRKFPGFWDNQDNVISYCEENKISSRSEFARKNGAAYNASRRLNVNKGSCTVKLIDDIFR